jgi:hypothetical protein
LAVGLFVFGMLAIQISQAGTIVVEPGATFSASVPQCNFPGGPGGPCFTTGYLSRTPDTATSTFIVGYFNGTDPTTQTFTTAFNTWNGATGNLWTLVNGGALDVTYSVTFSTTATADVGGIDITVNLKNYKAAPGGPTLDQLVWTQGLYTNFSPTTPKGTNIEPPANTLDNYRFNMGSGPVGGPFRVACEALPGQTPGANNTTPANIGATPAGKAYCDPIYPFQYADKHFFDGPRGFWPRDSFRAHALLSTVTFLTDNTGKITGRRLTVYDGVSYGFDLAVPEPGQLLPLAAALLAFALWQRRRLSL